LSAKETLQDADASYPRAWRWDEDGDTVEGNFVELGEAPTAGYGYKPILTLDVGGERLCVWVFHHSLAEKLRDELTRRRASEFTVDERIIIRRGERKTPETTGRSYVPYRVQFPDAPKRSAADVLGGVVDEHTDEPPDGDELPF